MALGRTVTGAPKFVTGGSVRGTMRVYGVKEAIARMKLVGRVAGLETGGLVYRKAQRTRTLAQEYCPVITGNLKTGIKISKISLYGWAVTASSMDGDNAEKNKKEYAAYPEFGSSHNEPKFYMTRAFNDEVSTLRAELRGLAKSLEMI